MSKFTNLPKRVLDSLIKTEKKIVTYPIDDKLKRYKEKFQDIKENRELIVVDKFGNRYYQYYSYHGLPSRRVVVNNLRGFNKWDDDPIMLGWLQKRRVNPPTQEELEKMYIEQEEFSRRGLEWDRKEQAVLDEWKKRNQEAIEKEKKETKAIGQGESFQPGTWERNKKIEKVEIKEKLNHQLAVVKEEKRIIEGMSTIPGKYIMDFRAEDEKWMDKQIEIRCAPYVEISKQIDWTKYSCDDMVRRNAENTLAKRQQIQHKQQELTNIGKKMLEKKQSYTAYNNFRERFKDIFVDPKFSAL